MMAEYEYIFVNLLHAKLKEKLHGGIFVEVSDDVLWVNIFKKEMNLVYKTKIDDFAHRILYGLNPEYVAYDIIKEYKKFINRQFFK